MRPRPLCSRRHAASRSWPSGQGAALVAACLLLVAAAPLAGAERLVVRFKPGQRDQVRAGHEIYKHAVRC
jgi:hypothetical protein